MAKLTAAKRNKIPKSEFGLPEGNLSPASAATIRAKANRILSQGHHRTSSGKHSFHNIQHPGHKEKMR